MRRWIQVSVLLMVWVQTASAEAGSGPAEEPRPRPESSPYGPPEPRLAFQGRLPAYNLAFDSGTPELVVPAVTTGIRFLEGRLFLGVGVGFSSVNDGGPGAYSLSPLASYDLLRTDLASLYVLAWLNAGRIEQAMLDSPFVGAHLGAGVRGRVNKALSFGAEWGWGFSHLTDVEMQSFRNGFFGNLFVEASIGL
jgi:hypothetical protein